jgi:hypothetical protein
MCAGVGTGLISVYLFASLLEMIFGTTFKITAILLTLYVFRDLFIHNISFPLVVSPRTYPSCCFTHKVNLGSSDPAFISKILLFKLRT